jgi:acetyltransferase-like isoleucine patch superfamily enzyme
MRTKNFVEKIIGVLKNAPDYSFEASYTSYQTCKIVYYRGKQFARGLYKRFWFNKIDGLFFCGKNVTIEHGEMLFAEKSLIIEAGVYINALSERGIRLGHNVTIARDTIMICTGVIRQKGVGITIGNNSAIGAQSFLGGQGGITIGDDVIMGPGVRIFSENHNFSSLEMPIRLQGESRKGVVIGNNCWIGASSTILDGICIGEGAVVAAGSVVTKNVDSNSVVGGVPAKLISTRGNTLP